MGSLIDCGRRNFNNNTSLIVVQFAPAWFETATSGFAPFRLQYFRFSAFLWALLKDFWFNLMTRSFASLEIHLFQ
jgi:hypothetical protein